MTRNLRIKSLLAFLWLLCYIPYKQAFLASERPKAIMHLGDLERFEDGATFDRWEHCLTYLNNHDINCSIRVKCQSNNFSDFRFSNLLGHLESEGHHIIHDQHCVCAVTQMMGFNPLEIPAIMALYAPVHVRKEEDANLLLSLPSDFFRDQFISLAKRSNYFVVEGDPTHWGNQQFLHFQQNIEYLLHEGIKFDNPQ
jgi:hypothetical protein